MLAMLCVPMALGAFDPARSNNQRPSQRRPAITKEEALRVDPSSTFPATFEEAAKAADREVAKVFEWEHDRAARFERLGPHKYWEDPRIHNMGNGGWRGALHALVVPIATHAIDR
jgi:hypothetical protein